MEARPSRYRKVGQASEARRKQSQNKKVLSRPFTSGKQNLHDTRKVELTPLHRLRRFQAVRDRNLRKHSNQWIKGIQSKIMEVKTDAPGGESESTVEEIDANKKLIESRNSSEKAHNGHDDSEKQSDDINRSEAAISSIPESENEVESKSSSNEVVQDFIVNQEVDLAEDAPQVEESTHSRSDVENAQPDDNSSDDEINVVDEDNEQLQENQPENVEDDVVNGDELVNEGEIVNGEGLNGDIDGDESELGSEEEEEEQEEEDEGEGEEIEEEEEEEEEEDDRQGDNDEDNEVTDVEDTEEKKEEDEKGLVNEFLEEESTPSMSGELGYAYPNDWIRKGLMSKSTAGSSDSAKSYSSVNLAPFDYSGHISGRRPVREIYGKRKAVDEGNDRAKKRFSSPSTNSRWNYFPSTLNRFWTPKTTPSAFLSSPAKNLDDSLEVNFDERTICTHEDEVMSSDSDSKGFFSYCNIM